MEGLFHSGKKISLLDPQWCLCVVGRLERNPAPPPAPKKNRRVGHDGKEKKRDVLSIFRLLHHLYWDAQREPLRRREAKKEGYWTKRFENVQKVICLIIHTKRDHSLLYIPICLHPITE